MRKIIVTIGLGILLASLIIAGCSTRTNTESDSTKIIVSKEIIDPEPENALFPVLSIKQILNKSPIIIQGIVTSRGESFERNLGSSSKPMYMIYTPVTIKVTKWIYGDDSRETIIYNEMGGETADKIMVSPVQILKLNLNDAVILFLNRNCYLLLPYTIYLVDNDHSISMPNFIFPDLKATSSKPGMIDISMDDFITQINHAKNN
jgi:hypothetical protein